MKSQTRPASNPPQPPDVNAKSGKPPGRARWKWDPGDQSNEWDEGRSMRLGAPLSPPPRGTPSPSSAHEHAQRPGPESTAAARPTRKEGGHLGRQKPGVVDEMDNRMDEMDAGSHEVRPAPTSAREGATPWPPVERPQDDDRGKSSARHPTRPAGLNPPPLCVLCAPCGSSPPCPAYPLRFALTKNFPRSHPVGGH